MENNDVLLQKLIAIVRELRGAKGCPWDKKQTPASLGKYIKEELKELLAAIEHQDTDNICEEAGDVLFLLVILTEIHNEKGCFTFNDVISSISEKLVRRHPHVFSGAKMKDEEGLKRQWEEIKAQEKQAKK